MRISMAIVIYLPTVLWPFSSFQNLDSKLGFSVELKFEDQNAFPSFKLYLNVSNYSTYLASKLIFF